MKNRFKNQNGVISVFAMLAMLFFLLFILGAYMAVSRSNRTQKESNDEILKIYSTEVNAQDIYNEMMTYYYDIKPLYTYADINKLGSKDFYAINGIVYDFYIESPGYRSGELKTNLNIDENHKYSDRIDTGSYKYVESDSLYLSLDGTNNTGNGFSDEVATWSNLVIESGKNKKYDIYDSIDNKKEEGKVSWTGKGLGFDGEADYVLCKNIINSGNSGQTLEIVFQPSSINNNQRLLGSWGDSAGGGLSLEGSKLRGDFIFENDVKRVVTSKSDTIEMGKVVYAALTFDGKNVQIYKNGKKISNESDDVNDSSETKTINCTTLSTVTKTLSNNKKIMMGLETYIGKIDDSLSKNGITIVPISYPETGYVMPQIIDGTISVSSNGNTSSYLGTNFYQNISDLKGNKQISFLLNLNVESQETKVDLKTNIENNNDSFEVIAKGSNSMIIKSDKEIQTWDIKVKKNSTYFDTNISPNSFTEISDKYYYCINGLAPNTSYSIGAKFDSENLNNTSIKKVEGEHEKSIFVGNSYNNKFDEISDAGFEGVIYAVRVYNKALTSDQIGTNYKIDKSRFSIID